jgi:protein-disulfide isomerase
MTKNAKISIALIAAAAIVLAGAVLLIGRGDDTVGTESGADGSDGTGAPFVRDDSQRLSSGPEGSPTFVEFLDFECEACGAAYPAIEELRERYGDQITFVVRYFPLHTNSEAAARAAEAAAAQGEFEAFYQLLFENQTDWAEQQNSQDDVFFSYAQQLGLEMDEFTEVFNDPATAEKVRRDKADGVDAGVTGTPTFFLDGEKVQVATFEELIAKIDAALNR